MIQKESAPSSFFSFLHTNLSKVKMGQSLLSGTWSLGMQNLSAVYSVHNLLIMSKKSQFFFAMLDKILFHELMIYRLRAGILSSRPLPRVLCWVRPLGWIYDGMNFDDNIIVTKMELGTWKGALPVTSDGTDEILLNLKKTWLRWTRILRTTPRKQFMWRPHGASRVRCWWWWWWWRWWCW